MYREREINSNPRWKEIKKVASEKYPEDNFVRYAFINGAMWALKSTLNNACKFLIDHRNDVNSEITSISGYIQDSFVDWFIEEVGGFKTPKEKVYREHRMYIDESLETQRKTPKGLSDIAKSYERRGIRKIWIDADYALDDRLPAEWEGRSYYVMGEWKDGGVYPCGMCNFYEGGVFNLETGNME